MVQTVNGDKVEVADASMTKQHWKRNKKPSVNFYERPFAVDRQLEDQTYLIEKNRNPRFFEPTKVDKVRSETICAKKGNSRAVAVKANVLNKIVREASGVYNYAIVAPPRSITNEKIKPDPDPETNPLMRPYAMAAYSKPKMCSYGHRPGSASRVFNPSTMKIRLRHGEIVATGNPNKIGIGLPVAVLQKLLYAPRIPKPGEEFDETESKANSKAHTAISNDMNDDDPYNLFSMESTSEYPLQTEESRVTGGTVTEKDSWVSRNESRMSNESPRDEQTDSFSTKRKKSKKKPQKLAPVRTNKYFKCFLSQNFEFDFHSVHRRILRIDTECEAIRRPTCVGRSLSSNKTSAGRSLQVEAQSKL